MNDDQLLRYSRHVLVEGFDIEGQERLLASKVLVVGAGGLGSPVALYLAAAGVGELWIADDDIVEQSNLQRQIAHTQDSIGEQKVSSAARACRARNPDCTVHEMPRRLLGDDLEAAVAAVDLVVDCSDNFATRFAINAACVKHTCPLVSGAAIRSEGQVAVFDARDSASPCYACLYQASSDETLNCAESGVIGPMVGLVGSLQALEAVKVLSDYGQSSVGRLLVIDGKTMEFRELRLRRDSACRACG